AAEPAPVQGSQATQLRASADCPEKYLVLYVSARRQDFAGGALLACLQAQRMTFGEMSIFHRQDADGEVLFSLVNAVEPGTFEPARMDDLTTPAISLFMRAHELSRPVAVYHQMLAVAEALASSLDGEVRDQARKPLTRASMERQQQDLQAFVDAHFH
ncbi:MAG: cell division protein ZipA C-terminal FtsZ-binding domain-containing protein, partial [Pseudomonadales bacterium]|nr:cell division protein ZipA C-terminal FtsZ-binding domain-containing protein [Pseudomonadales bacterium]